MSRSFQTIKRSLLERLPPLDDSPLELVDFKKVDWSPAKTGVFSSAPLPQSLAELQVSKIEKGRATISLLCLEGDWLLDFREESSETAAAFLPLTLSFDGVGCTLKSNRSGFCDYRIELRHTTTAEIFRENLPVQISDLPGSCEEVRIEEGAELADLDPEMQVPRLLRKYERMEAITVLTEKVRHAASILPRFYNGQLSVRSLDLSPSIKVYSANIYQIHYRRNATVTKGIFTRTSSSVGFSGVLALVQNDALRFHNWEEKDP